MGDIQDANKKGKNRRDNIANGDIGGDDWLNSNILDNRKVGSDDDIINEGISVTTQDDAENKKPGENRSTTPKNEVFGKLRENPLMSLKELKEVFKEKNYTTIKAYHHEWREKNLSLYQELKENDVTPLIPKKITSNGRFSQDYVSYSIGLKYAGQKVFIKEINKGKDIAVFTDAKSSNQIKCFSKKELIRKESDDLNQGEIKIGKKTVALNEFCIHAARETNQELAKRFNVALIDISKARKDIGVKSSSKFEFLKRDGNGNPLTPEERLSRATKYMKETVLTDAFKQKNNLKEGEAPTRDMMKESEHGGFYYACWKLGIKQNNILERLNLQPNKDFGKWDKIKYDENDNVLPKNEILMKASEYIKPFITEPNFRVRYNLSGNQAPTASNLRDAGHDGFIAFIASVGLTHNDVMRECNFDVNKDNDFWNKFRADEAGKPFSQEEKMHRLSQYFQQEIMVGAREKYNLGENEAPTQEILEKEGHSGFLHVIGREVILYNDLLEHNGYKPHDVDDIKKIGLDFHEIAKRITLEHCQENGVKGFSEVTVNKSNQNRPDITVPIDKQTSRLSPELQEVYKTTEIRMISVDFYIGSSLDNASVHSLRGYQSDGRLLVLVPTHLRGKQEPPQDIPFRNNVRIMSPEEFSKFVGFQEARHADFIKAIDLAKDAMWKEGDYREKLAVASQLSKKVINERFPEVSRDFRRYVANHPEMPRDILDDKKDKSRSDYNAQEIKDPVLNGDDKPRIASEGKSVPLHEHLQENAVKARDPGREEHIPDKNHFESTPVELHMQEEKTKSPKQNDEDTRTNDTREKV